LTQTTRPNSSGAAFRIHCSQNPNNSSNHFSITVPSPPPPPSPNQPPSPPRSPTPPVVEPDSPLRTDTTDIPTLLLLPFAPSLPPLTPQSLLPKSHRAQFPHEFHNFKRGIHRRISYPSFSS